MRVPPVENPTCAAFEEYEDVPKTVPLDFTEDDVTWVFHRGDTHVGVLLSEDICNRSPGFREFVPQEDTPSPLPVSFPTDGLSN